MYIKSIIGENLRVLKGFVNFCKESLQNPKVFPNLADIHFRRNGNGMGFNDFFINNNGKKEQLKDIKHGVRKEQVDKKFHNLFDAYDVNKDGTLEANELEGIFKGLKNFAGSDKVLDSKENDMVKSVFANEVHIQDVDFQGFVKSVSTASDEIVESKETPTPDGGKEVTTTYKDGTVETIAYYPDGEYKFKKVDAQNVSTSYYYTVGNNLDKKYTTEQIEDVVKKEYENEIAKRARNLEKSENKLVPLYDEFKNEFLKQHNVNLGSDTKSTERHDIELSERAKQDVAVKDFVLNHYIETHQVAKETLDTMGMLDDIGAAINARAGELWNSCKNLYNKYIGEGTEEDYKNFYELVKTFEPNHDKSLLVKGAQEVAQRHQENYFRDEIGKIDTEKGAKFQQITEQYQNAQILKQRLNLLDKAMKEIELYTTEQLSVAMPNDIKNPIAHINNANKLLLEYFGGDQNAVDMILDGAIGDENSKVIKAINNVKQETEKLNQSVLGGKSFDEIQEEYKTQYKEMYNTDFVPDELTEKVIDAKATGGFVKLAAITAISILITRSPAMTEVMGAVAGSAEATGVAANFMRTLVSRYGQTAVQQAIKLAMTSGTLATDVGLTLLNQATSERGINGEELWENTKSSAKYIFFGAYVGTPVAEAVGNAIGKFGLTRELMAGGRTTTQGAIKTTTLTGDKVFENVLKNGKSIGRKLMVGGAKLGTDVAMFSALGIATDGQEIGEAFEEQATFLPKLKVMNHVLEYVLGRVVGRGASGNQTQSPLINKPFDTRMEKAIKLSGIENWTVKEMQTPNGSRYTIVDEKGITQTFNDVNKLATAMLEKVAKTYEEVKSVNNEESGEKKAETTQENSPEEKAETTPAVKAITEKDYGDEAIPKAKECLERLGFTPDEIAKIDIKDANILRVLEVINNIEKSSKAFSEQTRSEEFKSDLIDLFSNKDNLVKFLEEEGKYYTNEICETFEKYVTFDTENGIVDLLNQNENISETVNILPIITQNGSRKILASQLKDLCYSSARENFAKITPEKVDLMYKINEKLTDKNFGLSAIDIANLEEIPANFADNYVKEANRYAQFGLSCSTENPVERLESYKKISDVLEKYPMDLTIIDNFSKNETKVDYNNLAYLANQPDLSSVQKLVNSLSKETKMVGINNIERLSSGIKAETLADLCNALYECGARDVNYTIIRMLDSNSKDYDGMVSLVKAYKGTKCLSWYGNERFVQVANKDYTGAAKYIELSKELGLNLEHLDSLIKDENADFKTTVDCLTYIRDNKIDITNYSEYSLLRDSNWKDTVNKIEFLKQQGCENLDNIHYAFCNEAKSNISFEEFRTKYQLLEQSDKESNSTFNNYQKARLANNHLSVDEFKEIVDFAQQNKLYGYTILCDITNRAKFEFFKDLNADKDFPKEYIAIILISTNEDNLTFAKKLCADKDIPKEIIANLLNNVNKDNINFAEELYANNNVPKDKIGEILKATKIDDPNDAGGNNGKIDTKKVDRYTRLFQNSNTAKWAGDMLSQDFDIETVSRLATTRQNFYTKSIKQVESKANQVDQRGLSPLDIAKQETIQEFETLGLDSKEANAIYKSISKNGVIDIDLKAKAKELINKGVQRNKIGDILNAAQITGEFNSKIIEDFVLLQNRGLNPLLEKNLAILNNISAADCATKFNSKVRNQIKAMINNLPDGVKNSLNEQGIQIDSILNKLDAKIVRTSTNMPAKAKIQSGFRSKAKITGFERIVVDRYEPTEQVWRNEEATKKWAEEKYQAFKNREYISTRNTAEDPQLGDKVTQKRKEMLDEWYNFMETDENIKNNPFIKVILCDFITKELEPERSTTPPALNKDIVKQVLGDAANASNFSFGANYAKKMKEISAKNSQGQQVEVNGRKGTWYTVPKTDSSSPDFKSNAAKIRAFSDGTNWCIRTWNAEPYVQRGAMHFFVDENGLTQICIREHGAPGSVYEIQKRQQDQTAPVAYLDVIQSYMQEHELKPQDYCKGELDKAITQKPEYDKLKSELDILNNKHDYKGILEKMGITVTVLPDGTFELSHYTSYINKIALNDFGINENELLANVSRIKGNANFKDSNATTLPLLQEVGGVLDFGYSDISNLKNLKTIHNKPIKW